MLVTGWIEITFDPEYQEYTCEVKLKIPLDTRGDIPFLLRNKNTAIFGDPLSKSWGNYSPNGDLRHRWQTKYIGSSHDHHKLIEVAKSDLEDAVDTLEKVAKENIKTRGVQSV